MQFSNFFGVFLLFFTIVSCNPASSILKLIQRESQNVPELLKSIPLVKKLFRQRVVPAKILVEKFYIEELENTVRDLRIANDILYGRVENLRATVGHYKEKVNTARKETQEIRRLFLSQIKKIEEDHMQDMSSLKKSMDELHQKNIVAIKQELTEAFEIEKEELKESLEEIHFEEIGSLRLELTTELKSAEEDVKILKKKLLIEKEKAAERMDEVKTMKTRQQEIAEVFTYILTTFN